MRHPPGELGDELSQAIGNSGATRRSAAFGGRRAGSGGLACWCQSSPFIQFREGAYGERVGLRSPQERTPDHGSGGMQQVCLRCWAASFLSSYGIGCNGTKVAANRHQKTERNVERLTRSTRNHGWDVDHYYQQASGCVGTSRGWLNISNRLATDHCGGFAVLR